MIFILLRGARVFFGGREGGGGWCFDNTGLCSLLVDDLMLRRER